MRTVGILGGMGPEATVLLMQRLIAAVPARDDADHIPLVVHQNPAVPSRIKRLIEGQGDDPAPVLAQMARDLAAAGAAALAMPCNTAHAYAGAVRAAVDLPFLDMVQGTAAHLAVRVPRGRIGMLASPAVRLAGVFDAPFAALGLTPVFLAEDRPLLAVIKRVKAGETGAAVRADFSTLAADLAQDSDHLLIACTELSLLNDALPAEGWSDSLDCLIAQIVAFARA